ncbi:MAG TPA: Mov34/MPN/PAD-1 family protein, partial [Thermoanaerobaculia bacterium]|nr:Mov34/MPN/PAD-1 family protein [Thermoanaerobaculia bacterium]
MLATLLFTAALSSPQAFVWYDQLLAEGGYGRFQHERAAFLIEERDGTLTLEPWPASGHRHATFQGAIPPRTIAIVHTHPADAPEPSARDRAEARRLGLPVIVITPRSVMATHPTGPPASRRLSRERLAPG